MRARPFLPLCLAAALLSLHAQSAWSAAPLSYLVGYGERARPVVSLTWGLLIISAAVVVIIGLLLLAAVWKRRGPKWSPGEKLELLPETSATSWIWIGTGISTVVLLAACAWTMVVLAEVDSPPPTAPFTIEIVGHQWWWEARYLTQDPSRDFTTANEIHVPTGIPVAFRLRTADVIHSFWIPQLTGKTDTIPGQVNRLWLEASKAGTYSGKCTEYCGVQHAHMALLLVADTPAAFQRWWKDQLGSPSAPPTPEAREGAVQFKVKCGSCHSVRGTEAGGVRGPDLSHLMTRQTIAAGMLPNTVGNLSGWIANPQGIKPGSLMPKLNLSGPELSRIRAYLKTLK